jgi:hypothetical protein
VLLWAKRSSQNQICEMAAFTNLQSPRRREGDRFELLLRARGDSKRQRRPGGCRGRVGPAPLSAGPPSEPDVRLSPHPARAGPSGLITQGPTIRSTENGSSAGPLTAAMAAASSLSVGSGVVVIFVFGVHLTTSARFRVRAPGPVSDRLSTTTSWRGWPGSRGFPLRFRRRHWLLGHPVPAEGLGVPCGRLTSAPEGGLDLDGVSVFHTHEQRSGWVPSLLRGRWCLS